MISFLRNLWKAQRNARDLASLTAKYDWLSCEHIRFSEALEFKEREYEALVVLTQSMAIEYRAALGNPTEGIPGTILEAHALHGRHTKWKWPIDTQISAEWNRKKEAKQALLDDQMRKAGLGNWGGIGR